MTEGKLPWCWNKFNSISFFFSFFSHKRESNPSFVVVRMWRTLNKYNLLKSWDISMFPAQIWHRSQFILTSQPTNQRRGRSLWMMQNQLHVSLRLYCVILQRFHANVSAIRNSKQQAGLKMSACLLMLAPPLTGNTQFHFSSLFIRHPCDFPDFSNYFSFFLNFKAAFCPWEGI